jgi:hypothetical protein
MTSGKLCLAVFLTVIPAVAAAQPSVSVDVGINVGTDSYDTVAPGDPVESVDVFYDQLSPYGVWVDEPDVGRVFVPDTANYVPYTSGHWEYTNLGFVWVSSEPYAWATSHYGRWAYSNNYGRWYWLPDTQWGPAWVEWRQTGSDFGWAPLAPDVVVRAGWQPPPESWHYCGAEHVLDPNVVRYYEPRERVVEIHRQARPIEHYSTISNVRVVVGPPAATLRERHVEIHRVRVEPRTVGRWTPVEARAQVARATEHRQTFEVQNQRRIESNARIRAAHVKVIEAHPQLKAQVNARVQAGAHAAEPGRAAPADHRPGEPARVEPGRRTVEPGRIEPEHAAPRPSEPARTPPADHRPAEPARVEPGHAAPRPAEPGRVEPGRVEPEHAAPRPAEPGRTPPADHRPAEPARVDPGHAAPRPAEPGRVEPERTAPRPAEPASPRTPGRERAPEPRHDQAAPTPPVSRPPEQRPPQQPAPRAPEQRQPPRAEPPRPAPAPRAPEHAQPPRGGDRGEPERKDPEHRDDRH